MDTSTSSNTTSPESSDTEEQDIQTVNIDDKHWTMELAPDRTLCVHKNGLPNNVCSYPCPYGHNGTTLYIDSLDLSDISDLGDHFLTTNDARRVTSIRRGLEEVPYHKTKTELLFELWFRLNTQLS